MQLEFYQNAISMRSKVRIENRLQHYIRDLKATIYWYWSLGYNQIVGNDKKVQNIRFFDPWSWVCFLGMPQSWRIGWAKSAHALCATRQKMPFPFLARCSILSESPTPCKKRKNSHAYIVHTPFFQEFSDYFEKRSKRKSNAIEALVPND